MPSPLATINELGCVATRQQLLARGHSGFDLTAAVRCREIRRIRRGWYASPSASSAQTSAVRVGGRLSHMSAARHYGVWPGFDERLHLTVTQGAAKLRPVSQPVVVHWVARGRQDRTSERTWIVSLEDCLRGVVATADRETAIACLETAITKFRLSPSVIQSLFRERPARERAIAAQCRRGSESGPESIVAQRLRRMHLAVRQQVQIAGVGRVDMVVGDRLVIEVDGRAYHSDAATFERDRRRDALLVARGYVVLRFSYRQVMFAWEFVRRCILAALRN